MGKWNTSLFRAHEIYLWDKKLVMSTCLTDKRPRKVICKSSHKKGNKSKHAIAPGKWNLRVICLKDKLKFNCFFFWTLLISLRMIKNKSRWLDCRSDVVKLISPSSGHFINLPWPLIYMNFSQHYIDRSVREKLTKI